MAGGLFVCTKAANVFIPIFCTILFYSYLYSSTNLYSYLHLIYLAKFIIKFFQTKNFCHLRMFLNVKIFKLIGNQKFKMKSKKNFCDLKSKKILRFEIKKIFAI